MNPKRFQVFQNNKPADCDSFPKVGSTWNKSVYDTFEEARAYAWQWIGPCYGGSSDGSYGVDLKVNEPYEFAEGYYHAQTHLQNHHLQSYNAIAP